MKVAKGQNELSQFNQAVKKHINILKQVRKSISDSCQVMKKTFADFGIHFKKLGDFEYNALTDFSQEINLDVALIIYSKLKPTKPSFSKLQLKIDKAIDQISNQFSITKIKNNEYIKITKVINDTKINFYLQPVVKTVLTNKKSAYFVLRNQFVQEDLMVKVTDSFKKANKIANNNLVSLKLIIKYTLKNDFDYNYNIDMLILRWFYEYFCKKIDNYIFKKTFQKKSEDFKDFNIKNFTKLNNLQHWFNRNVNFKEMMTYILERFFKTNTYYFNNFNFIEEELFESISRYSVFTNSNFQLPVDYFEDFKIFDLRNYESQYELQSGLSESEGYSKVAFDFARAHDRRYVVSPVLKTGSANLVIYQKALIKKSKELYDKLPNEIIAEIKSLKQREAMEALNQLAHNWLSIYQAKLIYSKPYFDTKYPIHLIKNFDDLMETMVQTIDGISEKQFLVGFDN
ncbi:hypothetical protein [Spiroplasma alleghenense]|uniref:Uncharacterized protein n=1 Tax=Spiroplasma alleghenense TaxID=216931 RepID=A0A345Z3T0_9MOLU|nr:hypothetical protein [Spiroplasma alleghenense]AXK51259.1 hypothetical protein SALLE_v1c05870 [Spiroplasma alleghenense]